MKINATSMKIIETVNKDQNAPACNLVIEKKVEEFVKKYKKVVIKPIYGNGGSNVFYLNEKDPNSNLKNFFKKLIDIGNIPMTLFHWELNNDSSILNEIVPEIDN